MVSEPLLPPAELMVSITHPLIPARGAVDIRVLLADYVYALKVANSQLQALQEWSDANSN